MKYLPEKSRRHYKVNVRIRRDNGDIYMYEVDKDGEAGIEESMKTLNTR